MAWHTQGCKHLLRHVTSEDTYDNREYIKELYDTKREVKHLNPALCLEAH